MGSVEIRAVDHSDLDAWLPLWEEYHRFYKAEIPKVVTRQTWARFLDPAEPMHAVIATAHDRVLGFAHSIYHRSTWTTGNYCYLQDLFVEPRALDDTSALGASAASILLSPTPHEGLDRDDKSMAALLAAARIAQARGCDRVLMVWSTPSVGLVEPAWTDEPERHKDHASLKHLAMMLRLADVPEANRTYIAAASLDVRDVIARLPSDLLAAP